MAGAMLAYMFVYRLSTLQVTLLHASLKNTYELAREEAIHKTPITSSFLQTLNATLMRTTGSIHNVMGGSFDSAKGEYRLCGVTAGIGGRFYISYQKAPAKVTELCNQLQERIKLASSIREQYELSFNAHLFPKSRRNLLFCRKKVLCLRTI